MVYKGKVNNSCTTIVVSVEGMSKDQKYTLWQNDVQIAEGTVGSMGNMGGRPPQGFGGGERPQMPEGMEPPEGFEFDGKQPPQKPGKQK